LTGDIHEGERFILDAGCYRDVRFNHRVVRAFWLAAYIAWEGYRAIAESPLDAIDLGRFGALLAAFDAVLSSDRSYEEPLPPGVAEPGFFPDKENDPEGRAIAELATIAVGWALLHEVRHIRHQQECTSADPYDEDPTERRAEELSCDAYAVEFLLQQVDRYAAAENVDPAEVARKRQLGIYFALFALTLVAKDNWGASQTHPAVQSRIDAARLAMAAQRSEIADAIAYSAFAALRKFWPSAPGPFFE
jgi:hypothetical protein